MTDLTEKDFQDNVIQLAKLFKWRIAHFRPARTQHGWATPMTGDTGFPDLTLAKQGRVIFAELKSKTGKVSSQQWLWLRELAGPGNQINDAASPAATLNLAGGGAAVEVYVWRPDQLDEIQKVLNDNA